MGRAILAVLAGYAFIGILIFSTDAIAGILLGMKSGEIPPDWYMAVSLVTGILYSLGGGYICAHIGKDRARGAVLGLVIFGELMGLASTVMMWDKAPHWYSIGLMLGYPPAVWFGGKLWSAK